MFRLIRLTFLLIVACAAAIFTAHLIGGTRPNPLAILFTNPDGTPCQRPCLLGVRPGETKYEDAIALLKKHPFIQQWTPNQEEGDFVGASLGVAINQTPEKLVRSIHVYRFTWDDVGSPLDKTTLGNLVTILGTPSLVGSDSRNLMTFIYIDEGYWVKSTSDMFERMAGFYFESNDSLDSIGLQVDKASLKHGLSSGISLWRGFGNIRRYAPTPTL